MRKEKGFSLVELLIVLVILGILAVIVFPFLRRARSAAENANAYATMRTIISAEFSYYSQNARFARLDELNAHQGGGLGEISGNTLYRGSFTFQMVPVNPTDSQLRNEFTIVASKPGGIDLPYTISGNHTGQITEIMP
ncbi:MAG: type II secretion system GspH family protein [Pyrinomonadaceae bacterium]|nr:type II secretion system GspH family protein [Pyrinomonadaceae bacterium]MCX7640406.1 type II secretion system GspH family protein [Pyrinomonadaceae bacterium]MDW8304833.1 type II secretion system protein [Acidobacteriota bacterium]